MSRGKELLKNTGVLLAAKISTQAINFFLLPLYTSRLTTEEYGRLDIYISLAAILVPFITLQIEMALFRFFISEKSPKEKDGVVSNSLAFVIIITGFISVLYCAANHFIRIENRWLLLCYYITQSYYVYMLQLCRAKGNNYAYGVATFLNSVISVLLSVFAVVALGKKIDGIMTSMCIAQAVSIIYMTLRTSVYKSFNVRLINIKGIKKLLCYSFPLVFNQLASWAINYSDRLIILAYLGESTNGIYSVAAKFANLVGVLFGVFNIAWTENVVRSINDKDYDFYISKVFSLTYGIYLIITSTIICLLPFIFHHLVDDSFSEAYVHAPILLIAMFFSGVSASLGSIYIAHNKTKEVSITTILAAICNVIVHFALLKPYGLFAASVSTLVSFLLLYIFRFVRIQSFFKLNFKISHKAIMSLFALALPITGYYSKNYVFILFALAINAFCLLLFLRDNREVIRTFVKHPMKEE